MLVASYVLTALSICCAAVYLCGRLRLFLTATTMLLASLLLIYGPAYLSFVLSSGEKAMLIARLSGSEGRMSVMYSMIQSASSDFGAIIVAMNISIALMFIGVVASVEIVDRLIPGRAASLKIALADWNSQALRDSVGGTRVLLVIVVCLTLFLAWISFSEDHLGTIGSFLSITGDEAARAAFRLNNGGSPNYLYRMALGAVAPMLVVWGLLSGWVNRSWGLLSVAGLLLVAVLIGKSEILSRAPPAFFLVQLIVAGLLVFRNKLTWRSALVVLSAVILILYVVVRLTISVYDSFGPWGFLYYRIFEVPSESALETFGAFPAKYPHTWGANIRPLAAMMGLDYVPAFTIISQLWHNTKDATSNALFIADAWVDFSYGGVIVFSALAGAACRLIDLIYLVNGKTTIGIAMMAAAFGGVLTLLVSALNTAFLSGGLLLAPLVAGAIVGIIKVMNRNSGLHAKPAGVGT
ncbi:hypothetical protein [Bradyrhizobium sp. JYMT SZCCT0180]|uniref:hypothetical protein n=1 Tax=Bradyrhizobium sp. JYMT SZCCT0180 TaxID=2807666 RepID=UPI001BA8F4AD|nr:hypothetical protein [Bradyrhizobium sp. JYMT SZCCT0180]MBR1212653.1 hypothetical protein [Bradyrhizobium sp. JYMT SZCCT0180]